VFAHNTSRLARPGWSTTRRCARYILRRLMIDRMTIAAVARELGLSWDTVNTIAMDATQMIVAADTTRLDGVRVIGVDEHRWSHTGHTDGFVTVIIDLTPVLEGTGRARLLDMVAGRSAAALRSWLANQSPQFRDQIEVVAMDGFGGYKTAATEVLPEATAVMDPFHVVALAGAKLDLTRQRIQQQTCGHRGRTGDPLYGVRRALRTRFPLLSSRQQARLTTVFADDNHLAVPSPGVSTSASSPPTVSPTAAAARPCWPASSTPYDAVYPRDWRNWPNSAAPCTGAATMCWPTSTTTPPTDPPKPSTGGWKPYAETPSDSATSPTTDCAHCCTAATSSSRSMHSKTGRAIKPVAKP
jgi:hypothetical protein